MSYMAKGELSKVLRVRVSPDMLRELTTHAQRSERSAGAVARSAIRSYLQKEGKR